MKGAWRTCYTCIRYLKNYSESIPFRLINGENLSYTNVTQQIAEDEYRNLFIVKDVLEALKEGRSPIILTSRTSHVALLAELLQPHIYSTNHRIKLPQITEKQKNYSGKHIKMLNIIFFISERM